MGALVVAPICVACIIGPVVLGSLIAGLWGGFTGNAPLVAIAIVIAASVAVYALKRRRHRTPDAAIGDREKTARRGIEAPSGLPHE